LETERSTHGISFPTASTSAFVAKLIFNLPSPNQIPLSVAFLTR
jgi:hypothetical protein